MNMDNQQPSFPFTSLGKKVQRPSKNYLKKKYFKREFSRVGNSVPEVRGILKTVKELRMMIWSELYSNVKINNGNGYLITNLVQYTAGSNKGETRQGDVFNNPFKLGDVDVNYTAARVVESFTGADSAVTASWFPVYDGPATEAKPRITSIVTSGGTAVAVADDASVTVGADGKTLTLSNGTGTSIGATDTVKVAYVYDNIVIPQNDLPIINAEVKSIPLLAKARRIAVYYSQIAAYQA